MCFYEYSNNRLASKKKPVLHKQYGCGGTTVRRHGKEDAQVTERRSGLPCSCSKNVGLATALFENGFARQRGWTCLKKVQMKRSVTGGEAEGCCPQRKSPCPTLARRKTKALWKGGLGGIPLHKYSDKYYISCYWIMTLPWFKNIQKPLHRI